MSFDLGEEFFEHIGLKGKKKLQNKNKVTGDAKLSRTEFSSMLESYLNGLTELDKVRGNATIKKNQEKDKKKGKSTKKITPEASLDLHSFTVKEAMSLCKIFIKKSQSKKLNCVKVITGKGLHSDSGPILKGAMYDFLSTHSSVAKIIEAPLSQGGSGAYLVYLKKNS